MSEIKRWLTMSFLLTFGLPGLLCAQEKSGTADGKNETPEQTSRTDSPSRKRPAYRGLSAWTQTATSSSFAALKGITPC